MFNDYILLLNKIFDYLFKILIIRLLNLIALLYKLQIRDLFGCYFWKNSVNHKILTVKNRCFNIMRGINKL